MLLWGAVLRDGHVVGSEHQIALHTISNWDYCDYKGKFCFIKSS